ncbi:MAG: pyridoxal phosphate-dependent aminotransferase [Chromatiales bacterium]|jgi:aspartate aminotransferase
MNVVPLNSTRPRATPRNACLNLNVRGLGPSATLAINEHSFALQQAGHRVIRLGLGQSPFPVPAMVVEALKRNAHQKDYLPVKGLPALRQAVADYHQRFNGIAASAEAVLIGPGSKELMFILQLVFYGDLVIPAPSWVSYSPQASIIGRQIRRLHTRSENGWRLQPEELEALCQEDPNRPRLLILNYPNNPLGVTYSSTQLAALAEVARRYGMLILSDEIYGELHFEGRQDSIARYYPEGTIVSSGLSKWAGAGGWRLGTFLFPQELYWLLDAMAVVASETYTTTSAPIQHAAVSAYLGGAEIDDYLIRSRRVLRTLGPALTAGLRRCGCSLPEPEGGFYLFPDFSTHRERLNQRGIFTSVQLCQRLLDDAGIATLPGSDFGRPADEFTLRLAYVDFDGAAALQAADTDPALDEDFLWRHCANVMTAIDRIGAWLEA